MTNPIAVLLIIGSAVVGPIEAQRQPGIQTMMTCNTPGCNDIYEPLPQLCERAMREIGIRSMRDDTQSLYLFHDGSGGGGKLGNLQVLCIPVPTGYRK